MTTYFAATTLAFAATLVAPSIAAAQVPYDRAVDAVAILPDEAVPGNQRVIGVYRLEAEPPSVSIDAATDFLFARNGSIFDLSSLPFTFNPSAHSGCGIQCTTFQTCVCCNADGTHCICGSWIAPKESSTSMQPGDEIMVLLRPSPGAAPEFETSNDQMVVNYSGKPRYWDRRIVSATMTPSQGPPGAAGDQFFDIVVDVEVQANYDGVLNLGAELELRINGVPFGTIPVEDLDFPITFGECETDCLQACAFGPGINYCRDIDPGPGLDCHCVYAPGPTNFQAVPVDPDDDLEVILRPVPGALPELPGFPDDEEPVEPACPQDINGDGAVGPADLALLLDGWGPNAGHPADFNDDGFVGPADLAALLEAWGQCFPV